MKLPFKSSLLNWLYINSNSPRELARKERLFKKKRKLIKKKI